ncbi:hypothetical protein IW262DRAFT_1505781 [Armillaria fumosa]|nr:hypothetical protein IW262DRAFT_1505781 [Armillaria fumosa]
MVPHIDEYVIVQLDPVISLKGLEDPEATKACEALVSKKYVGCITWTTQLGSQVRWRNTREAGIPVPPAKHELTAKDATRLQMLSSEDKDNAGGGIPSHDAGHELQAHVAEDIGVPPKRSLTSTLLGLFPCIPNSTSLYSNDNCSVCSDDTTGIYIFGEPPSDTMPIAILSNDLASLSAEEIGDPWEFNSEMEVLKCFYKVKILNNVSALATISIAPFFRSLMSLQRNEPVYERCSLTVDDNDGIEIPACAYKIHSFFAQNQKNSTTKLTCQSPRVCEYAKTNGKVEILASVAGGDDSDEAEGIIAGNELSTVVGPRRSACRLPACPAQKERTSQRTAKDGASRHDLCL